MEERVERLERNIEAFNKDMVDVKTRLAIVETGLESVKQDIMSIKNNTTWILRLIMGAIIAALLNLIMKGGI